MIDNHDRILATRKAIDAHKKAQLEKKKAYQKEYYKKYYQDNKVVCDARSVAWRRNHSTRALAGA